MASPPLHQGRYWSHHQEDAKLCKEREGGRGGKMLNRVHRLGWWLRWSVQLQLYSRSIETRARMYTKNVYLYLNTHSVHVFHVHVLSFVASCRADRKRTPIELCMNPQGAPPNWCVYTHTFINTFQKKQQQHFLYKLLLIIVWCWATCPGWADGLWSNNGDGTWAVLLARKGPSRQKKVWYL